MTISYAITVCNEFKEVKRLITLLNEFVRDEDEIVVLFDKGKGTEEVWDYLQSQKIVFVKLKHLKTILLNGKIIYLLYVLKITYSNSMLMKYLIESY